MAKFKNSFVTKHKEDEKQLREQQRLKEKHHIADDVVVVEKSNMTKFAAKLVVRLVKLIATLCLLTLAAIGLTCLIYPDTREAFLAIFGQVISDAETMITTSA